MIQKNIATAAKSVTCADALTPEGWAGCVATLTTGSAGKASAMTSGNSGTPETVAIREIGAMVPAAALVVSKDRVELMPILVRSFFAAKRKAKAC